MLRFARAIHDTTHHRHIHAFDAGIGFFPDRHLLAQIGLNLVSQILEHRRGGAAATGTGNYHRREFSQAHGLQDLLSDNHFPGAIATRLRCQRNPYGVANTLLQQHRQGCGRSDNALAAHTGLSQTEMQRIVAAPRQLAINSDQILHAGYLARQDNAITLQAQLFRSLRVLYRRGNQGFIHHRLRRPRLAAQGILIHDTGQQSLVQATPVDADPHRFIILAGGLDHLRKLRISLGAFTDITRIDPILRQRLGAVWIVIQQRMAVVVEITDQRYIYAHLVQLLADRRHCCCRFRIIYRDAHQLGTSTRQVLDLDRGADGVGGIGIGHGLHHYRRTATNHYLALAIADQRAAAKAAHAGT